MTTKDFFLQFIDTSIHKTEQTLEEYHRFRDDSDILMVKATTMYQIYKGQVFEADGRLSMREFYKACANYFYYDKYVCTHGIEFYYYVKFNEQHQMYQIVKPVVLKRVAANSPDRLRDLEYIIEAVTKHNVEGN